MTTEHHRNDFVPADAATNRPARRGRIVVATAAIAIIATSIVGVTALTSMAPADAPIEAAVAIPAEPETRIEPEIPTEAAPAGPAPTAKPSAEAQQPVPAPIPAAPAEAPAATGSAPITPVPAPAEPSTPVAPTPETGDAPIPPAPAPADPPPTDAAPDVPPPPAPEAPEAPETPETPETPEQDAGTVGEPAGPTIVVIDQTGDDEPAPEPEFTEDCITTSDAVLPCISVLRQNGTVIDVGSATNHQWIQLLADCFAVGNHADEHCTVIDLAFGAGTVDGEVAELKAMTVEQLADECDEGGLDSLVHCPELERRTMP
ncbi:MAG: hypothetical protein AAGA37_01195 [Actinomycetota bacterium]